MKVSTLINKLKKLPQDATVIVHNNSVCINGFYKAYNGVAYDEIDNTVCIFADYDHLVEETD